jgi:cytochrome c peroxidase
MKYLVIIVISFIIISFKIKKEVELSYPSTWPKPTYDFKKNPLDSAKIKLGRLLFYEPKLSRDGTISCANCHLQNTGFTHIDHDLSHGIDNRIGKRNSIALVNLAWSKSLMWDGAIHYIDAQALAPIENHDEMDNSIANVVNTLKKDTRYKKEFSLAYGDTTITGERVSKAIAQFCLTLVSSNSKYDQVKKKNSQIKFSELEEKGYSLFKKNCNSCHTEPMFSNYSFKNNGLAVDPTLNDLGRMGITLNPKDSLLFKVPSLRNIALTSPYMHDGRYKNLQMVLFHYSTNNKMKIDLGEQDKKAIIAFLKTLTDERFVGDKQYAYLGIE